MLFRKVEKKSIKYAVNVFEEVSSTLTGLVLNLKPKTQSESFHKIENTLCLATIK